MQLHNPADNDARASRRTSIAFPAFRRDELALTLDGVEYVFVRESNDGTTIYVERRETGTIRQLEGHEFWKFYEAGRLLIGDGSLLQIPQRFVKYLDSNIDPNRDKFARDAFRRFKYTVAVDRAPGISKTDNGLAPVIAAVAAEISDSKPPAPKTLARWLRERGAPQMRALALMVDRDDRKGRGDWLGDQQDEIVEEIIERYYKTPRQLNVNEIYEEVGGQIGLRNRARYIELGLDKETYEGLSNEERLGLGLLTHPDYTTVLRRIRRHLGYDTTARRDGKKIADDLYRPLKDAPRATRANQIWYIDHTRIDLHLVYDKKTKAVLGRAWMTVVIDAYSRYIVGFYITFLPPSVHSLAMALKNAISTKRYVGAKFPSIEEEWISYGLPDIVVCDRGLELTSSSFEMMSFSAGIDVMWCARKKPQWKAIVERVNGTIRTHLINLFGGSTRKAPHQLRKEERNPTEEAEKDLQALDEAFHKWVISVYAKKTHKGIQEIPAERYAESIKTHRPRLLNRESDISLFGIWQKATLSRAGITFLYLNYKNFNATFDILNQSGAPKVEVSIIIDPSDLAKIIVMNPKSCTLTEFTCTDPGMSEGVSLWERRAVLAYMRAKNYNTAKREAWLIAKKEIRDGAMRTLLKKNGKISEKQRAARALGISAKGSFDETPFGAEVGDAKWLDMEFSPPGVAADFESDREFMNLGDPHGNEDDVADGRSGFGDGGRPARSRAASPRARPPNRKKPSSASNKPTNSVTEAVMEESGSDSASRLDGRLANSSFPSI